MNMLIKTNPTGQPLPGLWYETYLHHWRQAFPSSHLDPGHFLGTTWHTQTPAWDNWWFNDQGVHTPTIVNRPTPWRP